MRKLVKLLVPATLLCASLALFSACDNTPPPPPNEPPEETVYTKTVANIDDTYTYKFSTQDGLSGTLSLYDGAGDKLLQEHAASEGNGKYRIGGEGRGLSLTFTVSGETFEFDGYSYFPGFVMPYASVAGTYDLLMPDGSDSPGTVTFNADGTGTLDYGSGEEFTYYTVGGNKAIMVANDLMGEYVEFTAQGLKHLGSVYSPGDYVYFNTEVYAYDQYEVMRSMYHVTHLGVEGESILYYNDAGAYRIDRGSVKIDGSDDYYPVENIYFGKTTFQTTDRFTFTCQSRDGYGYEMEKSVENDKHYVTVRYETLLDEWGETRFDYQCEKTVNGKSYWRDYYFGRSSYAYFEEGVDDECYSDEGVSYDFGDGYKTLRTYGESVWGNITYHHVIDPETVELKYVFYEYGDYIHYYGMYEELLLTRGEVDGVQPGYVQKRLFLKTRDGANDGHDDGYMYQNMDNKKYYERLGYFVDMGNDSLVCYTGTYDDPMYAGMKGYCYIDRANGTYQEIESSNNEDMDENLYNATSYNPEGTRYEAAPGEEVDYMGAVVYDYKDGSADRAYLFLYNCYSHEPMAIVSSYNCESYSYTEQADGDEMVFVYSYGGTQRSIVIKLTTDADKKIASVTWQ